MSSATAFKSAVESNFLSRGDLAPGVRQSDVDRSFAPVVLHAIPSGVGSNEMSSALRQALTGEHWRQLAFLAEQAVAYRKTGAMRLAMLKERRIGRIMSRAMEGTVR